MEFSRCTRTRRPPHEKRRRDVFEERTGGRSLKTQERTGSSPTHVEVAVDLRELEWPDDEPQERRVIDGSSSHRSKSSGVPRKEVIQPQLPRRLPCYDFTPILNPTFDGCLPYGLAHRLRVLPTFVV